jgi:uncharacterized membrane protein
MLCKCHVELVGPRIVAIASTTMHHMQLSSSCIRATMTSLVIVTIPFALHPTLLHILRQWTAVVSQKRMGISLGLMIMGMSLGD